MYDPDELNVDRFFEPRVIRRSERFRTEASEQPMYEFVVEPPFATRRIQEPTLFLRGDRPWPTSPPTSIGPDTQRLLQGADRLSTTTLNVESNGSRRGGGWIVAILVVVALWALSARDETPSTEPSESTSATVAVLPIMDEAEALLRSRTAPLEACGSSYIAQIHALSTLNAANLQSDLERFADARVVEASTCRGFAIPGRTYAVHVGEFATSAAAQQRCDVAKASGVDCYVARTGE